MNSRDSLRSDSDHGAAAFGAALHAWRHLLFLVALVGLVLLFYAEEDWRGYYAWSRYKQQMVARGEPTEPEAFIPPPVADEENFALTPALNPLFDFVPGTQQWRNPKAPRLFEPLTARYDAAASLVKRPTRLRHNSWVPSFADLDLWAAAFAEGTNAHRRGREIVIPTGYDPRAAASLVLDGLSGFTPILEEFHSASKRPHSRFHLRYEQDNPATILLPHLSKLKYFCQVLQLRASAELALGRKDAALADIQLMTSLIDATRTEPIVISQLVRIAEVQLALQSVAEGLGQWSETDLRDLQERLRGFDFLSNAHRALEAERVLFGGGVIEYVRHSPHKARALEEMQGGDGNNGEISGAALMLAGAPAGWLYLEQRNFTRLFGENLLPLLDLTNRVIRPASVRRAEAAIARAIDGRPATRLLHHQLFSSLLLPSLSRITQRVAFAQTGVDTAIIACALERYRIAHSRYPEDLQELTPQFIEKLPKDIISGNQLNYHLKPDGYFVLYSVGWNEQDDGGEIKQTKNGVIETNEGDWVWSNEL